MIKTKKTKTAFIMFSWEEDFFFPPNCNNNKNKFENKYENCSIFL